MGRVSYWCGEPVGLLPAESSVPSTNPSGSRHVQRLDSELEVVSLWLWVCQGYCAGHSLQLSIDHQLLIPILVYFFLLQIRTLQYLRSSALSAGKALQQDP